MIEKIKKSNLFKKLKKNEKLLLIVIAVLSFVISMSIFYSSFAFEGATGISGDCKWTIDTQGKMTIEPQQGQTKCTLEGYEEGKNYSWHNNRLDILSIEVKKGVKANTKSQYLFAGLDNVKSIDLSYLITDPTFSSNGSYMFKGLSKLENLNINTRSKAPDNSYFVFQTSDYMFQGIGSALENGTIINIGDSLAAWGDAKLHDVFAGSCIKIYKVVNGVVDTSQVYGAPAFNDHISEVWAVKGSEGACGTSGGCKWTIDTAGKMIIEPQQGQTECTLEGYVEGKNYSWYNNRLDILSIEVKEGVKANRNSNYLFAGLDNVKSIDLSKFRLQPYAQEYPNYLQKAFYNLKNLEYLNLTDFNIKDLTGWEQNENGEIFCGMGSSVGTKMTIGSTAVLSGGYWGPISLTEAKKMFACADVPTFYELDENGNKKQPELNLDEFYDKIKNTTYNFVSSWLVEWNTGSGTGGNTGNEGGNTGNEGGNTGNEGGNTGNEGGNTGNEGGNTGNEGGNTGNQGGNTGNEGGNTGNEGGNTGNQGGNTGNEGGNTGNEGGNTGNEGGNTGTEGGNTGNQGGNTGNQGNTGTNTNQGNNKTQTNGVDITTGGSKIELEDVPEANSEITITIPGYGDVTLPATNGSSAEIKKGTETITITYEGGKILTIRGSSNMGNVPVTVKYVSKTTETKTETNKTNDSEDLVPKESESVEKKTVENPYTGDKIIRHIIASAVLLICILDLAVLLRIRKKEKKNL